MLRQVIRRPAANRDLIDCFVYIARDSEKAATRAAEDTFLDLAGMPGMGVATSFGASRDRNLHRWRVRGFENFLIFYYPIKDGIEVIRVLPAHVKSNGYSNSFRSRRLGKLLLVLL